MGNNCFHSGARKSYFLLNSIIKSVTDVRYLYLHVRHVHTYVYSARNNSRMRFFTRTLRQKVHLSFALLGLKRKRGKRRK